MTRLAKVTAIVVATLLGLATLWELRGPVLVLLLSVIVAAAVRTPADYLAGRGLPKSMALAGTYLVCLLLPAAIVLATIYLVGGELRQATEDFRRMYDYVAKHSSSVPWLECIAKEHAPPVEELLSELAGRHGEQAARLFLGTAFGIMSTVIDGIFVVVLSIYWTIDREYFERLWLSLLPLPHRVAARSLWRMLEAELGAYVRSEIIQSLLAGLVLAVAFYWLGLGCPILLALVAALSWLVPWLGAIIALLALAVAELPLLVLGWPASLFSIVTAALFTVVVFVLLESVVEPRMFNRQRYNSLFIVLAVMALAQTFGILGLLLGPMVAVAIQAAVEHVEREQITARRPTTDLPALAGRLADLRSNAAADDGIPQEWTSIVDRLAALIAEAVEIVDDTNAISRELEA